MDKSLCKFWKDKNKDRLEYVRSNDNGNASEVIAKGWARKRLKMSIKKKNK